MLFSDVLESMTRDGDQWRATVSEDWHQGRTLFGGVQVALCIRAMRSLLEPGLPLRALQATFVGPVTAGEVRLAPALLRSGKNVTQVECELARGVDVACTVVGTFGRARESTIRIAPPTPAEPPDVTSLTDLPFIAGIAPSFVQHLALRWASGMPPFSAAERAHTATFVRFRHPVRDPEAELVAVADAIPSPVISLLSSPAPVSSLTWMLELVGAPCPAPPDGWWLVDTEVTTAGDGYATQSTAVVVPGHGVAALSRQSVAVFA